MRSRCVVSFESTLSISEGFREFGVKPCTKALSILLQAIGSERENPEHQKLYIDQTLQYMYSSGLSLSEECEKILQREDLFDVFMNRSRKYQISQDILNSESMQLDLKNRLAADIIISQTGDIVACQKSVASLVSMQKNVTLTQPCLQTYHEVMLACAFTANANAGWRDKETVMLAMELSWDAFMVMIKCGLPPDETSLLAIFKTRDAHSLKCAFSTSYLFKKYNVIPTNRTRDEFVSSTLAVGRARIFEASFEDSCFLISELREFLAAYDVTLLPAQNKELLDYSEYCKSELLKK